MKLVINSQFGGFELSQKAVDLYKKYINEKDPAIVLGDDFFYTGELGDKIPRYDPCLLRVLEEIGAEAGTSVSRLTIVEIPDNIKWMIQEYDGYEWVTQAHKIYSDYPMASRKLILGKGTESQEIHHPRSIYDKDQNGTALPSAFDECRMQ